MLINLIISVVLASQVSTKPNIYRRKPYENPKYVEGDMVYPESILKPTGRGVLLRGTPVAWPNGIIPYQILPGYGPSQEAFIIHVMEKMKREIAINNVACIQFRPKIPSDQHYINFYNGEGCSSPVGRMTGESINHTVTLEYPACFEESTIMHELLHTLGFLHEQSRPDRDDYIKIHFENINSTMAYNFDKYDNSIVNTQNTPYDYASVMHYESDAFSLNGLPTIESLQPNVTFGQRYNMSTIDIQEVRLFYNCSANGITFPPMPTTTTANLYVINVTLSSSLTTNSEGYTHFNGPSNIYYYEIFEVRVPVDGDYILTSSSSMDTYGLLYRENFYRDSPDINVISGDNDGAGNLQFQMNIYLKSDTRYLLSVTTGTPRTIGNFTILVYGLSQVTLRQINSSSTIPTPAPTTVSTPAWVLSTYSGELTRKNPIYDRFGGSGKYYYAAIEISVSEPGYYIIESCSTIDTFGYLYSNSFNSLNIEENLIAGDDDKADNYQFLIQHEFKSMKTYILIVTTHDEMVFGSFSIFSYGPKEVKFTCLTASASIKSNIITNHLVGIIFGFILRQFIST